MEKNEVGNIHFITVGNQLFWRFYDVNADKFRLFLKTPVGFNILLNRKDFFLIGKENGKVYLFELKDFTPVLIDGDFSHLSVYNSYIEDTGNSERCEHVMYIMDCNSPNVCNNLLIYGDDLYFVKQIHVSENEEKSFVEKVDLMSGKTIKIIHPLHFDEDGNSFSIEFFVSEE